MPEQKVNILLVEDSPTDARLVQLDLSQAEGYSSNGDACRQSSRGD